ncbi:uncharacterized protein LOC110984063 [Acanthaster planci]|uniref:Uncharacterized protein LOC110984063 n=1 Tax=Acanthaster planci TaxID=133434 RepID=A0A8B7Z1S3_ACAPL|nr:uncharacterized protein LOC110984063 [Acanthaster planci]XP_022099554.1 uncharacterized protein LOC110984063 [Acanthaster planci]XP_022099555.1 uncharacterized protein LOC110984063 [Acanthaster planci]XP_022099556.1 uncharacterized protein LOC110984063 [Acanthaster planci]
MAVVSDSAQPDSCSRASGEEDELERLAVEELMNEAKRAKERAQTMGTYGWQKRRATTNKRFLHNTLVSTLRDNTDSRHRRKKYWQDSRTFKSRQFQDIAEGHNPQLAPSGILNKASHNVMSSEAPTAESDGHPAGRISGLSRLDPGLVREEDNKLKPSGLVRPHNHHGSASDEEKRRGKRSTSPLRGGTPSDDGSSSMRGHHRRRKKSQSSKHKKKSKHRDMHSPLEGLKNSRRREKR